MVDWEKQKPYYLSARRSCEVICLPTSELIIASSTLPKERKKNNKLIVRRIRRLSRVFKDWNVRKVFATILKARSSKASIVEFEEKRASFKGHVTLLCGSGVIKTPDELKVELEKNLCAIHSALAKEYDNTSN